MKSIARFLLVVCSFAPVVAAGAPVSQTSGSNLTGYNGSLGSVVGNQWNTMTNPRTAPNTAKADYGNCNALILRCATPKCSGGGCTDMSVAQSIAMGCVNANASCKKFGEELATYIAGQLVSDSVAAANKTQAAAAASAAASQNAAMQQQMSQMQQQMAQMQQQNNAQLASLQNALEESQRNNAASAANTVATTPTVDAETGLTKTQEVAAKSGVSEDIITRATISGQILTGLEGVDISLSRLKSNMREAFKYGGCNEINGNSCKGPKRVAKFRELANKFFEPYDELGNSLEDALFKAQSVGVDLGNVYMFFSGSCNRWAEYVCRYDTTKSAHCKKLVTKTEDGVTTTECGEWEERIGLPTYNEGAYINTCCTKEDVDMGRNCTAGKSVSSSLVRGSKSCYPGQVIPPEDLVACSVNKFLSLDDDEGVTQKILNPDATSTGSVRVGCASDLSSGIIKRRRSSSKTGGIDIDLLEIMINQHESSDRLNDKSDNKAFGKYCYSEYDGKALEMLKSAVIKKSLGSACCVNESDLDVDKCKSDCYNLNEEVSYVNPAFALCDIHAWNAGFDNNEDANEDATTKAQVSEIIGLKTTVMTQQMYKQYASLEAVMKQLKILLEKEVLKNSLQVAGASSATSNDESATSNEFEKCSRTDEEAALTCLISNYDKLSSYVEKKNIRNDVKKQLKDDGYVLSVLLNNTKYENDCKNVTSSTAETCLKQIGLGINALRNQIRKYQQQQNRTNIYYGNSIP